MIVTRRVEIENVEHILVTVELDEQELETIAKYDSLTIEEYIRERVLEGMYSISIEEVDLNVLADESQYTRLDVFVCGEDEP